LPKLSLRDAPDENSFSSVSSPAPGPLSPPLGLINTDIGDLHDVPINDNTDTNIIHSRSLEEVYVKLYLIYNFTNRRGRGINLFICIFVLYIQVPADTSEIFLKIKVTSPQKIGDGMGAYLAYNVETRTNMLIFKKRHFNVLRRFSDFLGLHDKLTEKYLRNGRIIPPAPEKSVIGKNMIYFYNLLINLKE